MPTILITGSSKGIGFAIAKEFASQGFDVIIHGRDWSRLNEAKNQIHRIHPSANIHAIAADLSTQDGISSFEKQWIALNSPIDVLVNNAGLFLPGPMMGEEVGQFDSLWQINMSSAYHVTRFLWNGLKQSDRAHVFNMCSIASVTAYEAGGTYSLVKHALLGFSKSLRKEGISQGIRVTALLPGATLTDSWAGVDLPEARFMKPESVAKICLSAYQINQDTVMEEVILRPILGDI